MEVFRLQRAKYGTDLSGAGAAIKGARWNSIGTELIYTSSSRALVMAEVAVHFSLATLPRDYILFHIFVPDSTSIKIVQLSDLPADWNTHPPPVSTTRFGDELVRANHYCLLRLPSAVVQGDYNTLINPRHPDFIGIHVVQRLPFTFDNRLFGSR